MLNLSVSGFKLGVILAIGLLGASCTSAVARSSDISDLPPPEDTEDWSVQSPIVTLDDANRPSDAIILFDGTDLSQWEAKEGGPAQWEIEDEALRVVPETGNVQTRESFCDAQLHIEWRSPLEPLQTDIGKGQLWGNSGVFLQSRYEVQILNSFGNETYANGQAGSIYKQYPPAVNASRPAGAWQSYDIIFTAPRFSDEDSLVSPARLTVLHNGVLIQNNVEVQGRTVFRGSPSYEAHDCAPLMLQDHWEGVEFRNIWIRRL